jgi:hypothetical protein
MHGLIWGPVGNRDRADGSCLNVRRLMLPSLLKISSARECSMKFRKSTSRDRAWRAAEVALNAAQQMPAGPVRAAALKVAGQLRLKADERRLKREQRKQIGPTTQPALAAPQE